MSKKVIVLDCDDVILDWHNGFVNWVEETTTHRINLEHAYDTWDMWFWFEKMSKGEFVSLVKEFNGYPRVLQPCEMVRPAMLDLSFTKHEIIVLTSFGGCPVQTKFRQEYLKVLFGDIFSDIIVLELGECKKKVLEMLSPDIFIEDNKSHAEKALDLGIKTYLVSTTYNQGCEDAIYVNNLYEAVQDIVYGIREGE